MKIAFFDSTNLDYSPATPGSRPLGGSQSGLCYLSRNMARAGHKVALVNNISQPGNYSGVDCPGIENGSKSEYLNEFDVVIVLYAKLTIDTINQAYDDPDGFSERLAQ